MCEKFDIWWSQARNRSPLNQKSPICISTIDETGFPQGRFVDLKSVTEDGFIFCSDYNSAKGKHISLNSKVALTAWWDHVGYQVRVVGIANKISQELAQKFWETRSIDAQISTCAFEQSNELRPDIELESIFGEFKRKCHKPLRKPSSWGGYIVAPISVEFLQFKENRLHLRDFYQLVDKSWLNSRLQP